MSLDQRLKEIKDRCDAATPGPWKFIQEGCFNNRIESPDDWAIVRDYGETCEPENQIFIAHARQDIPMLLKVIEVLMSCVEDKDYFLQAYVGEI